MRTTNSNTIAVARLGNPCLAHGVGSTERATAPSMARWTMETKQCSRCGQAKPLSAFNPSPRYRMGVHCWCRQCQAEYAKMFWRGKRRVAKLTCWHARITRARDEGQKWLAGVDPQDAAYICGLVDGEGSFVAYLTTQSAKPRAHGLGIGLCLRIGMRIDEMPLMKWLHQFWQCGSVHSSRRSNQCPMAAFQISAKRDLVYRVIPFFRRFPLRAKKRQDFEVWQRMARLAFAVGARSRTFANCLGARNARWTDHDLVELHRLRALLSRVRGL